MRETSLTTDRSRRTCFFFNMLRLQGEVGNRVICTVRVMYGYNVAYIYIVDIGRKREH